MRKGLGPRGGPAFLEMYRAEQFPALWHPAQVPRARDRLRDAQAAGDADEERTARATLRVLGDLSDLFAAYRQ